MSLSLEANVTYPFNVSTFERVRGELLVHGIDTHRSVNHSVFDLVDEYQAQIEQNQYSGPSGDWREVLPEELVYPVERYHLN